MKKVLTFCFVVCCVAAVNVPMPVSAQALADAQDAVIRPGLLHGEWPASWISCPGVSQRAYGVYHFRKTFVLGTVPGRFVVHLSADNRYRLFVNGKGVCFGPARSDLAHW